MTPSSLATLASSPRYRRSLLTAVIALVRARFVPMRPILVPTLGVVKGNVLRKVPEPNWASEVKALRATLALTQDEFALKVGVSGSTVGYWESGEVTPHKRTRERVRTACSAEEPAKPATRRYSEETISQLHQALDIVIDKAPSTAIQQVSALLEKFAGVFGTEREELAVPIDVPDDLSEQLRSIAANNKLDTSYILREALSRGLPGLSQKLAAERQRPASKEAHKRVHHRS